MQGVNALGVPCACALILIYRIGYCGAGIKALIFGVKQQTARMNYKRRIALIVRRFPAFALRSAEAEKRDPIALALDGGIFHGHIKAFIFFHIIVKHRHCRINILTPGAALKIALRSARAVYRPAL